MEPFCDFRLGLETGAQGDWTKRQGLPPTIYSIHASEYEKLGVSATTAAFANADFFRSGYQDVCSCAHRRADGNCFWENTSRAWVNCSLDTFANTEYDSIANATAKIAQSWFKDAGWDGYLFLDVEGPDHFYDPTWVDPKATHGYSTSSLCLSLDCWVGYDDAAIAKLATGYAKRFAAWRSALPNAKLGLWNTFGPDFGGACNHSGISTCASWDAHGHCLVSDQRECYSTMAKKAQRVADQRVLVDGKYVYALDEMDFLSPELYGHGQSYETVRARLSNNSLLKNSRGAGFKVVPNPSWLDFDNACSADMWCSPHRTDPKCKSEYAGVEWKCPIVNRTTGRAAGIGGLIDHIKTWNRTEGNGSAPSIIFWSGTDDYPGSIKADWPAPITNKTMLSWFTEAGLVPAECRK